MKVAQPFLDGVLAHAKAGVSMTLRSSIDGARFVAAMVLILGATFVGAQQSGDSEAPRGRFLGAKQTVYPDWFKDSFLELEADVEEASEFGKRVMLFFHQDGCPYCNALVERNFAQKDIERRVREHLDVIGLNMWGDREVLTIAGNTLTEKSLAEAMRVQFTPTLVFLDETGKTVLRINGYYPPQSFRVALDYVIGRQEKTSTWREYYETHLPPASSGKMNEQPFFGQPPYVLTRAPGPRARPLAVFFEQPDCPNCDDLHRRILTDPPTRQLIEQFEAVQLDMWSNTPLLTPSGERTTARDWARALGVTYAPTIVYFAPDGGEIIRSESFFRVFHSQSMMDYVLSGAFREQPSFQRYLSDRADSVRERGSDVDIWR